LTVVIIAHRLSTIRNVDHVFVFDKGHLVEHGPYAVLRDRQNSRFRGMADLQNL
jgi:subfamily B ATP-binding cassette protein MsbA